MGADPRVVRCPGGANPAGPGVPSLPGSRDPVPLPPGASPAPIRTPGGAAGGDPARTPSEPATRRGRDAPAYGQPGGLPGCRPQDEPRPGSTVSVNPNDPTTLGPGCTCADAYVFIQADNRAGGPAGDRRDSEG